MYTANMPMLNQTKVLSMNVHMLLSMINMKLRNEAHSLSGLCRTYALDENQLVARLQQADYVYLSELNQFR